MLYELSTPFLNIHSFFDKLGLTGIRAQLYNGLALLVVFFCCQLVCVKGCTRGMVLECSSDQLLRETEYDRQGQCSSHVFQLCTYVQIPGHT